MEGLWYALCNIDLLGRASLEELTSIPDIGEVIAQSILDYFATEANRQLLSDLQALGLPLKRLPEEEPHPVNEHAAIAGKTFVISGVFSQHSREEYKALIESLGGKVGSSISSKTSYVLAGENMGPSKLAKATDLGIQILSEADFLALIGEGEVASPSSVPTSLFPDEEAIS